MKLRKRIPFILAAATIFVAAFSAFGQKRPDFNRLQTFDAQHYVIRASFDRANKKVIGDTTVSLKPLKNDFRVVELDGVGLSIEAVSLDPSVASLSFKTLPGKLTITPVQNHTPPASYLSISNKEGNNVFEGGFLGLDNITVVDRSEKLPDMQIPLIEAPLPGVVHARHVDERNPGQSR